MRFRDHLSQARRRAFAGRQPEIATLHAALQSHQIVTVLYVHGSGGIGKTALLHRYASEAETAGTRVVRVEPGADPPPEETPVLVLVDDFDGRPDAEQWLRDRFLPELPAGSVVVVAARRPPAIGWAIDPGWRNLLLMLRLGELTPAEADELVVRSGVPEEHHSAIRAAAGRHPLALRLACELTLAGWDDRSLRLSVARTMLQQVVGDLPSMAHRHLLERTAYSTNLSAPTGGNLEAFHWLCAQTYVDCDPSGVHVIPGVGSALRRELRWRDPARHHQLIREADTVRSMTGMQRADFDRHLRAALRTWRQPDRLADNPLAGARIVAEHELAEPGTALQAVLKAAVDVLGGDTRGDRIQRVMAATYLKGLPTQEAAAERLGLPSSTYRRHLAQGIDRLSEMLWRQEHPNGHHPG